MAVTVEVRGLKEAIKALKLLGDDMTEMKDANSQLGAQIASRAAAIAPRRSGALAGSIRSNRAQRTVSIKAGNANVPYAGVIEYGWPAKNRQAQPYLRKAAFENRGYIAEKYEENITSIIRKYNFD